ncbi:MAG: hypothetical protein AUH33_04085 [Chloroflexi bacterium 13_1_40CM_68_21]|nr:MAG: hypothetical protein AUH33_04085 [Chloroflexi bacterium 13_1_40CM_68_21]
MTLFALFKLIHVASVVWMFAGLLGRFYALGAASRATEIRLTRAFADLGGRFETTMVIPGSSVVLVSGIATALVGGFPLFGPLQGEPAWIFVSLLLFAATLALVPTVFLPRGKNFGAALEDATAQGEVTPKLKAAFADPVVVRSHWVELAGFGLIFVLMVLKPF